MPNFTMTGMSLALSRPLFARPLLTGLLLSALLAGLAALLAQWEPMARVGLSALTLAIAFGILIGNTVFPRIAAQAGPGVDFARSTLLRTGIVLYGFRISLQDLGAVGWHGVLIAMLIVGLTFNLALYIGTRWLGMDRQTSMLIGAGSAICGAAAVMATQPIVRGEEHKVSVAIATVVVFGTLSMVLYPLMFPYLDLSLHAFGLFAGSTIHEVAQVVAVGDAIGGAAASTAVVEKMVRVMLLAPFLLLLSFNQASAGSDAKGFKACLKQVRVPWFAVMFLAVSAFHSLDLLPRAMVGALVQIDTLLLATAMAAMGLRTSFTSLQRAGIQPLKLGALLFVFLLFGGYLINLAVLAL
jgi:uncharacterized integral membrane protein (TIGR00698 family)